MKSSKIFLSVILLIAVLACTSAPTSASIGWTTEEGLMVPESVIYDSNTNMVYVACINGNATEKDNNGFISRITTQGEIETLKWITGIDAPKGMGIYQGKLYVTDVDRIHVIDIAESKIVDTLEVEGAQFLNDIAIDEMGTIYITDMKAELINTISKGKVEVWADLSDYNRPNGIFMEEDDLLVGASEGILRIDLADKTISLDIAVQGGIIDGLKSYGKDSYLISDWTGKIQIVSKTADPIVLSDTSEDKINAADFEYIPQKKMILVPTFYDNRVVSYNLK